MTELQQYKEALEFALHKLPLTKLQAAIIQAFGNSNLSQVYVRGMVVIEHRMGEKFAKRFEDKLYNNPITK